jgi:hypothetical protein
MPNDLSPELLVVCDWEAWTFVGATLESNCMLPTREDRYEGPNDDALWERNAHTFRSFRTLSATNSPN